MGIRDEPRRPSTGKGNRSVTSQPEKVLWRGDSMKPANDEQPRRTPSCSWDDLGSSQLSHQDRAKADLYAFIEKHLAHEEGAPSGYTTIDAHIFESESGYAIM